MDKIRIKGSSDLYGSINVSGSKNASLPILVSSLLSQKDLVLKNVPKLEDIKSMIKLLQGYGVTCIENKNKITLNASNINNNIADYDLVRKMRASILILGPLLARFRYANISLPGGCAIGTRPIDIHLDSLSKLGVKFQIENGFIKAFAENSLKGNIINLPFPSVGATENLIMAASLSKGNTVINNPAKEPEINDLIACLNMMGAKISISTNNQIKIQGVDSLRGAQHSIMSDRIVAGTFIILAVMLNKKFKVKNINSIYLTSLIDILKKMQANLIIEKNFIQINPSKKIIGASVQTAPYPGFPTDLQAQIMALMSIAKGSSKIVEKIFENRFMHVAELNRLGASIKVKNDTAFIMGDRILKGAQVMASDLRASVSLILAGLCAEGETIVHRVYHLDRGYEKLEEKLKECGPIMFREN